MSTVKITDLEELTSLNSNTSNTILVGVNLPTMVTGKITATTLARGLYSHNQLNVGNNQILFPNTIAQFANTSNNYIQTNLQNINNDFGTADYVVTANTGSDVALYIDLGFANKTFNNVYSYNGLGSSLYPLDGYLYVQGNTAGYPGGNLVIGTASVDREIRFIGGGINTQNVVVRINSTGLHLRNNANLSFTDGTTQTTAAASNAYSVAAFALANTVNTNLSTANTFLQTMLQANDVVTLAAATAYTDTANTKLKAYSDGRFLANVSGTFAGSLNITGRTNVSSQLVVANSTYDYANTPLVRISGSSTSATPANSGYMLDVTGIDGIASRIVNTAYGTGVYGLYTGRSARGTAASPLAVANNDVIARYSASAYNGTRFTTTGQGRIDIVADEDFTVANNGTRIEFYNIIPKTNTLSKIATFNSNTVTFSGAVYPNKGFIYTPRIIPGNSTTIVLDFATDSMIKASINAACTLSFTNYQYGKVVELWVTNTSGSTQTFTHGCSASNSTNNNTSQSMPAGSSMYLRYFSINGDLANTFVAVTQG